MVNNIWSPFTYFIYRAYIHAIFLYFIRSVARFLRCNSCKPTLARPRSSLRSVDRSRPSRARSPRSLDRTKRAFGPRPRTVFSGPRARTLLHRLVRLSHHERLRRRRVVHRRRRRRHRRLASASVSRPSRRAIVDSRLSAHHGSRLTVSPPFNRPIATRPGMDTSASSRRVRARGGTTRRARAQIRDARLASVHVRAR